MTQPPDLSHLLTALSSMSQSLSQDPRQLAGKTGSLLSVLRQAAGVDAAELYLADPAQQYLVRTGHSGPDSAAFSQRSIFKFGEGFPGLAAQLRIPAETDCLGADPRYLRRDVQALGYRLFLSYPLLTPHAVVGVLNLAAKDARQMAGARQALALLAPLFASNLYAVMTSLGELVLERVRRAEQGRERSLVLLQNHLGMAQAERGALRSLSPGVPDIETHPGEMRPCQGFETCPVREGKVCVTGLADLSCVAMPPSPHMICLPLWNTGQVSSVVSLEFAPPSGPREESYLGSETLAPLLWLGRLAAPELPYAPAEGTAAPPWLAIQTFGGFRVVRAGQTLTAADFKRRQAYQLLKVLVSRWGRPMHAEELCEALWPGEELTEKVLARLHVTLNALRQALEPGPEQRGKVLVRDGSSYCFAPTLTWRLDAAEFETAVHQADAQAGQSAIALYAQALALYTGDYLEGDPYADAFALERDYLRELAVHALFRTAELQRGAGHMQEAVMSYSQLLTIDPFRFDAHEELIALLSAQGRLEEARSRWERYAQAYGSVPPLAPPGSARPPLS